MVSQRTVGLAMLGGGVGKSVRNYSSMATVMTMLLMWCMNRSV